MAYLVRDPIDLQQLLASVSSDELGGTTLFVGTVRSGPEDGPVESIVYTAYQEMVVSEFDRILAETRTQWPGIRVAIRHRVGAVRVGEVSVAIAAAMPHRDDAFAACRYVIEEVKKRAPIWKKEYLETGAARWRADRAHAESGGWDSQ